MDNIEVVSNDEITLFTDDEKVVLKAVDFEFEQANAIRSFYNKLTVFNGSHCDQSVKNKDQRKIDFYFNISHLRPLPIRQHKVAWKWALSAILFLLISLTMAYAGLFSTTIEPSSNFKNLLIAISLFTVIFALLAFHFSYDKFVFKSEFGNINIIELLSNQPDTASFKTFLARFTLQVRRAKLTRDKPLSDCLAGELRELRRLKDEMVISTDQYESAKTCIFKHDGFSQTKTPNN